MRPWLNRQRSLADYALASLARRRFRTTAVLVVYAGVVALFAAVMLYAQAVRREAALVLQQSPAVLVQRTLAGRHQPVPLSYVEALAGLRGVQSIDGRLWGDYYDAASKATYTVMVPPASSGREVPNGLARVGAAVARALGVREGGRVALVTPADDVILVEVAEILPAESEVLTADIVLLSAPDFRALFGYPEGYYTDLAVSVANPAEHRTVAAKVTARLQDVRAVVREDMARTYASIFNWREGLVLVVMIGVIGAFAVFAFDRASGLAADESREIAILRAVGWDAGDVMRMKLWEGAALSGAAFGLGYLAAYAVVFYLPAGPFDGALRGWTALRPRHPLTPDIDPFQLATLFLLTVVPYTAAVLVPVWRVAVTDPDSVIRG